MNLFCVECQYRDLQSHNIFDMPRQKIRGVYTGGVEAVASNLSEGG